MRRALASCTLLLLALPAVAHGSQSDALVLGSPESPILDQLERRTNIDLTESREPEDATPANFGMLVIDGDELSSGELRGRTAIENFVAAGEWILAVDLAQPDVEALESHTGFIAGDESRNMTMFRVGMAEGSPMIEVVDAGPPGVEDGKELSDKRRRELRELEIRGAAGLITGRTGLEPSDPDAAPRFASTDTTTKAPCGTLTPVPLPGLQHIGWCYTTFGMQTPPDGKWDQQFGWVDKYGDPGRQTANWTMNHRFDIFLDNDPVQGSAKGNFDVLYYALNGEFAPKRDPESFFRMYDGFVSGWNAFGQRVVTERAWWTGRADPVVRPQGAAATLVSREDSQPQSANNEVTFSSSESFSVGFSGTAARPDAGLGIGVQVGWTSEKGKSYNVPSWSVQNRSSGKDAAWSFSSRQPCDTSAENEGRNLWEGCFTSEGQGRRGPALPNEISRTNLQLRTSARWRTTKPIETGSAPLEFAIDVPIRMIDTYCSTSWNGGVGFCPQNLSSGYGLNGFTTGPRQFKAQLEADWVNPVGIESLALSSNRANGDENQRVTGTITLKRPAKIPVDVQVVATGLNAKLIDPFPGVANGTQEQVRIEPNEKSGKFTVFTNADKLKKGESTTTLINAFYAEKAEPVELRVFRP